MRSAVNDISTVQLPAPLAVVVPTLPSMLLVNVMEALASDVPDIVRLVVFLVMLSELESPVSSSAVRSRPAGALGVLVSMVMFRATDDADALPAVSVATAVTACTLFAERVTSIVQLPAPSAVVSPRVLS